MIRNSVSVSAILPRWPHGKISSSDPQLFFLHTASTRNLRRVNSAGTFAGTIQIPTNSSRRNFASNNVNGSNGSRNGISSSQDIINSTAAATEWKRNQYRKITEKFQIDITKENEPSQQSTVEPLQIDNYEDLQPMWKEMESRVTRRRSLTLEQRGGRSGRQNVRRSDEDVWLDAGVYGGGTDRVDNKKE